MLKLWWIYRDRDYWRSRAETLETKLDNEVKRNRHFEREIISRWINAMGQMGIANDAPAQPRTPQVLPPIPPEPTQPILNTLTPQQLEDWKMYEEDAALNGVPVGQAWNDFYSRSVLSKMMIEELVDVEN